MELRPRAIRTLKRLLHRGMRYRAGFRLTRLIAEEHRLFAAEQIVRSCLPEIRHRHLGDTVLRGPFAGLKYRDVSSADELQKLIGSYEAELHPILEEICRRPYRTVVNIGAAEGYYAIGLARRLPNVTVYAFEGRPGAQAQLLAMAKTNGVHDRVTVGGWCTRAQLAACPLGRETLIVSDCEACEYEILEPHAITDLRSCDLLIELHRCQHIRPREHFTELFGETHEIRFVDIRPRDPRQYPELAGFTADQGEALLYERTDPFGWVYLRCV